MFAFGLEENVWYRLSNHRALHERKSDLQASGTEEKAHRCRAMCNYDHGSLKALGRKIHLRIPAPRVDVKCGLGEEIQWAWQMYVDFTNSTRSA